MQHYNGNHGNIIHSDHGNGTQPRSFNLEGDATPFKNERLQRGSTDA